jgi:DNA-binding response OmpR family regulator
MPHRGQILVLSQQIGLRVLLRLFFTRAGYDIDIVTTRVEAKVILDYQKQIPDLVILDLYLSDEPGLKFAADVRALHPQLPILLVPLSPRNTAVSGEDVQAAAELGVAILPNDAGIGGHNFNSAIHLLLDRA